jgi:hypothetical protein
MLSLVKLVGAALCGGGLLLSYADVALAEPADAAILEIVAIKASKNAGAIDPRLRPMMADLEALPYASFTLLGARACTVGGGDRCGMKVSDDAYLVIRSVENAQKYIRLNVLLNRKNKPVLDANLKINRNAGVVLTNMRREGPALVMSIKVRDDPRAAGASASADH